MRGDRRSPRIPFLLFTDYYLLSTKPTSRSALCYYYYMQESHTVGQKDLEAIAERVVYLLSQDKRERASVVLLEGDMGAGKTTFTQILAKYLGVVENVNSPTFILKKEYKTPHSNFRKVIHIDAYRFIHPKESKVLRLEDDLEDKDTIVVIEWPSKMNYIKADIRLSFEVIDDDTREITLVYEKDI